MLKSHDLEKTGSILLTGIREVAAPPGDKISITRLPCIPHFYNRVQCTYLAAGFCGSKNVSEGLSQELIQMIITED